MIGRGTTTKLTTVFGDAGKVMTGDEMYPLIGSGLTKDELEVLMEECRGLNEYWDCLRKAYIVKQYLGRGVMVVGGCMVMSVDKQSAYGHYWNPPFEFHAWRQEKFYVDVGHLIIDIAFLD